jgi:hypothetical protein
MLAKDKPGESFLEVIVQVRKAMLEQSRVSSRTMGMSVSLIHQGVKWLREFLGEKKELPKRKRYRSKMKRPNPLKGSKEPNGDKTAR